MNLGALLMFVLGWGTQVLYMCFTEEDWDADVFDDSPPFILPGPVRAWQKEVAAEAELQSNVWSRLTAPELSFRAGQAQMAPYYLGLSIFSMGAVKQVGMGTFHTFLLGMRAAGGGALTS